LPRSTLGYAESLGPDWAEVGDPGRTMLCQSRLAYVFTHSGLLGVPRAEAEGKVAIAAMQQRFWRAEARGWIQAIDAEGRALDDRIDSYDQAFGLLALAWAFRATGDRVLRNLALEALAGLDAATFAPGPGYEGYPEARCLSGEPASGLDRASPRRQNPHMHLLEAFLAWHGVDPAGPWLERAGSIVRLARRRFIDPVDGTLGEFFDETLAPASGDAGSRREPGHHFEWVWLLKRWQEASGDPGAFDVAGRLYRFASERGRDADGLAFDAVEPRGRLVEDAKLLWPQTEMLKAHLAWFEWRGEAAAKKAAVESLGAISTNYFVPGSALFRNRLARDRSPLPVPAFSRVLYHLFLALVEAERVLGPQAADRG
jgi:mannose/cellobiose epimerase-like protein (N-acyl-D-glucosamine 2-epimerase family)